MNETVDRKHSGYGVASCLIGVPNLSYTGILLFDCFNEGKIFLNHLVGMGPGAIFRLFFIPLLFLLIPTIGNGIGLVLGIIGLSQTNRKKPFAVLGLIMHIVIPVILVISYLPIHF